MVDFETSAMVDAFFKMSSWRLTENKMLFLVLEEFLVSSRHPLPFLIQTSHSSPRSLHPPSFQATIPSPHPFISPILHPLIPPPSHTLLWLDLIPSSRVRFWSVHPGLILTSTFLQLCTSPTNNWFCRSSCR